MTVLGERRRGQPPSVASGSEMLGGVRQIGDVPGALAMPGYQRGQFLFAFDRCLQERSGRQRDLGGTDRDHGRRSHQHQFAVTRQPRQPMLFGDARQPRDRG